MFCRSTENVIWCESISADKDFFEMAEQIRQAPKLTYQIYVREAGEYEMICYTAPANPVCQGGSVYFGCAVNGNAPQKIEMIPDGYRSGEPSCAEWAKWWWIRSALSVCRSRCRAERMKLEFMRGHRDFCWKN